MNIIFLDCTQNYGFQFSAANTKTELLAKGLAFAGNNCIIHNGLTGCGSQGDWACHQLEHALSGIYDVTHAAGLSAIWGSWARYVVHSKPERFAAFAERVMGVSCEQRNVMERALCGIKEVENFFIKLNMPISLKQLKLGLTNDSLRKIVYYCSYKNTRCIGDIKKIDCEGMYTILKNALE